MQKAKFASLVPACSLIADSFFWKRVPLLAHQQQSKKLCENDDNGDEEISIVCDTSSENDVRNRKNFLANGSVLSLPKSQVRTAYEQYSKILSLKRIEKEKVRRETPEERLLRKEKKYDNEAEENNRKIVIRKKLIPRAYGSVLEVGVGQG